MDLSYALSSGAATAISTFDCRTEREKCHLNSIKWRRKRCHWKGVWCKWAKLCDYIAFNGIQMRCQIILYMISFNFQLFFYLIQMQTIQFIQWRFLCCALFFLFDKRFGQSSIPFETVALETRKLMTDTVCSTLYQLWLRSSFFFFFLFSCRLSVLPSAVYIPDNLVLFSKSHFAACHRLWECNLMDMSMRMSANGSDRLKLSNV